MAITVHQRFRPALAMLPTERDASLTARLWVVVRRLLNWKGVHGCVMVVTLCNVAGRVLVTPITDSFECYTYPAYKPVNTTHYAGAGTGAVTLVPEVDPNYGRLPWAYKEESWATMLLLAPYALAFAVPLSLSPLALPV